MKDFIRDESIGNEAGACYFLDFLGFVYNVPSVEDFTLSDYYYGKYPLPIAYDNEHQYFINYNLNYYIEDPFGTQLPIGWDLTVDGYWTKAGQLDWKVNSNSGCITAKLCAKGDK